MVSPEASSHSLIRRKIVEKVDQADPEHRLEFIYKGCTIRAFESLGNVYWYIKSPEGRFFEYREEPAELNYSLEESGRSSIGRHKMQEKIDQLIAYGRIVVN